MSARRTKVAKHPGVYYRDTPQGRRYEVTYLDEYGRRRWQVVEGNLGAAEAALDERKRRKRSGEPVAPGKVRLREFAERWLAAQTQLRPRTRELYRMHLKNHVYPRLGRVWVHEIREDDLTGLITEMREAGLSGYTAKGALTPLGRVLNSAVRRLERGERPAVERREIRTLDTAEVGKPLDACGDTHRTLVATAVFTGLRQGEVLGLTVRAGNGGFLLLAREGLEVIGRCSSVRFSPLQPSS